MSRVSVHLWVVCREREGGIGHPSSASPTTCHSVRTHITLLHLASHLTSSLSTSSLCSQTLHLLREQHPAVTNLSRGNCSHSRQLNPF